VTEASASFACFGAQCAVLATGAGAEAAVAEACERLLGWHERFTRFSAASELSRMNADPRAAVPVSADLGRLAAAVAWAAEATAGLVDGTLLRPLEAAGYRADLARSLPVALALRLAPPRRPAGPSPRAAWREIQVEAAGGALVRRPPGVAIDSGGLAKGLCADLLAEALAGRPSYGIDCAGDLRIGGAAGLPRTVHVTSPLDGGPLHALRVTSGGVATSGIARRAWLDARGRPAHHLLDPATGRPAYTGLLQVTALAPTALAAEVRAKAALLSGPDGAHAWLPDGGVVVHEDGRHEVLH
jgi:FAD:protein FMN transferase